VLEAILAGLSPEVETDPAKCGLGRWLVKADIPDGEIREIISQMKSYHDDLHRSVIAVQEHIRAGKGAQGAIDMFDREIAPLGNEVIKYLKRLKAAFEARGM